MSRLLAIDTSGPQTLWCGVEDGNTVDPVLIAGRNRHDSVLADGVAAWLDAHSWRDSVDAVAVVVGPGGFTGLRVGVAFASGLAEALGIKVVPVETTRLLAARVEDGLVWALTRAGGGNLRGQVVRGGMKRTESGAAEAAFEAIGDPVEFDPRKPIPLPPGDDPLLPLGEGYLHATHAIDTALGSRLRTNTRLRPLPDALALAVSQSYDEGRAVSPLDVDVIYGSDFRPTPKPNS